MGSRWNSKKASVAEVKIQMTGPASGYVTTTEKARDRQGASYHALLTFCLYYAKTLFVLGLTPAGTGLHAAMEAALEGMIAVDSVARPDVLLGKLELQESSVRSEWPLYHATLMAGRDDSYKLEIEMPEGASEHAADAMLLYLQDRIRVLPDLELAYLALSIRGMHQYHKTGQDWHSSKSLHPAPGYGISYARNILERRLDT